MSRDTSFTRCVEPTVFCTTTPPTKLILELWPYGLRQAATPWPDLIAALEEKGMFIRQVSAKGLTPFLPDLGRESADWYTNLFASRE